MKQLVHLIFLFILATHGKIYLNDNQEDHIFQSSPIDVYRGLTSPNYFVVKNIRQYKRDIRCINNGKQPCSENCQQGKYLHHDGCCTCYCLKNYKKTGSISCTKASWNKWGSWSACIKTDWGGLQTKERMCKSNKKEAPGSCDGRGSVSKKCSAVTGEFRIRKNVKNLTNLEFHDLIQAMTKFKNDKTKRGYRNIISWHGWPGRCPWYHNVFGHGDNHCSWHHHPLFLPWHRLITLQLELGLSRYLKNKTLGIPFWNWTEHADDIPYIVRNEKVYDPILKKLVHNPFYRTFIRKVHGVKMYSQRYPWYPGILMNKYLMKGVVRALLCHDYSKFDRQQSSNPHDQIHDCLCMSNATDLLEPQCRFSMTTVEYAAWDPIFLLHHSAIDRLFAMRRRLEEVEGVADWTRSRVVGQYLKHAKPYNDITYTFDMPLSPFCNKTMNPESVTGKPGVWTLHKSYYEEQLFGYRYSDFDLSGSYTWNDLRRDYKSNVINKRSWNDEYFETKLGNLATSNSLILNSTMGCVLHYKNTV